MSKEPSKNPGRIFVTKTDIVKPNWNLLHQFLLIMDRLLDVPHDFSSTNRKIYALKGVVEPYHRQVARSRRTPRSIRREQSEARKKKNK